MSTKSAAHSAADRCALFAAVGVSISFDYKLGYIAPCLMNSFMEVLMVAGKP